MKLLQSFFASCFTFFLPVQGILIAVGAAIALDTFTGVFRAGKQGGWKAVTSRRLSDVVGKILLYNAGILSIYAMDTLLLSEFFKLWFSTDFFFTKIVAIVLVVIELKSVRENFEAACGQDLFRMIRGFLRRTKEIRDDVSDITH